MDKGNIMACLGVNGTRSLCNAFCGRFHLCDFLGDSYTRSGWLAVLTLMQNVVVMFEIHKPCENNFPLSLI